MTNHRITMGEFLHVQDIQASFGRFSSMIVHRKMPFEQTSFFSFRRIILLMVLGKTGF